MFQIAERGSTVGREVRGGLVTFLTLSYILFLQPAVMSATGIPYGDAFFATCVCSAVACLLMGLLANYPFALAPAVGHNFFFAFTVCGAVAMGGMGFSWQQALMANLIAGGLFLVLSFFGLREAVMHAVPESLKYAIAVGIGLLIAFVGLQYGGLVQNSGPVLVQLGDLTSPIALVVLGGLAVTAVLSVLRVRGAILLGVLVTAVLALVVSAAPPVYHQPDGLEVITQAQLLERIGVTEGAADPAACVPPDQVRTVLAEPQPSDHWWGRIISLPKLPGEAVGAAVTQGWTLFTERSPLQVAIVIFIFFFLDLFDTVGTLIGISERAGFLDENGRLPRARWALFADSAGTVSGALLGTSTITSYVESAAGVAEGARTGLATLVTGGLLLASLFLYPLVEMVGRGVRYIHAETGEELIQVVAGTPADVHRYPIIAPVLILIGVMMMGGVRRIGWDDYTEAIPAFLTVVMMQFSLSIAEGIAWGFIAFTLLKLVAGKARDLNWMVVAFAVLFLVYHVAEAMV